MANNTELVKDIYSSQEEVIDIEEIENGDEGTAKVTTLDDATRYAYGLSETRKSIGELQEIAQKEIDKWQGKIAEVQDWLESVTAPLKSKEEYLATQLQIFHTTQFFAAKSEKEQKKLNSIKLPYGVTLKSRAQADKLEVADDVTYKEYAKNNDLLKVKEPEVDWAAMKKNIIVNSDGRALNKETGEFMDFIKVVPQERKFEVK